MLGLGLNFGSSESGSSAARMGGPALLLDTYGSAAAAYSLRRLATGFSVPIHIRRGSDNTEVTVYFDASGVISLDSTVVNLTEVTTGSSTSLATSATNLGQFVANGGYTDADGLGATDSAFVVKWFDQSGNRNDATQLTAGNQPKIVESGAVIVENGKAAVDFDGTSELDFTTITKVDVDPFAVFTVAQDTPNNLLFVDSTDNQNDALLIFTSYGQMRSRWNGSTYLDFNLTSSSLHRLFSVIDDGTNPVNTYYSGVNVTDASYSVTNKAINLNRIGGVGWHAAARYAGIMQEAIFYNSDQSDNRTDIESNINTFYSIY